jgi:hypothetical protein
MIFIRPVWACLLAVIAGLGPPPALCPGAGVAERPQEILYGQKGHFSKNRHKNPKNELPSDSIF